MNGFVIKRDIIRLCGGGKSFRILANFYNRSVGKKKSNDGRSSVSSAPRLARKKKVRPLHDIIRYMGLHPVSRHTVSGGKRANEQTSCAVESARRLGDLETQNDPKPPAAFISL